MQEPVECLFIIVLQVTIHYETLKDSQTFELIKHFKIQWTY